MSTVWFLGFIEEVGMAGLSPAAATPRRLPLDVWLQRALGVRVGALRVCIGSDVHRLPGIHEIREKGAVGPKVKALLYRLANC